MARITDCPNMTIAVNHGHKVSTQTNKKFRICHLHQLNELILERKFVCQSADKIVPFQMVWEKIVIAISAYYSGLSGPGPKVMKLFSCSAQLRLKFILLINVKRPTIVGLLTFISRINYMLC